MGRGIRPRPLVSASSTTAVPSGSISQFASTSSPEGPSTRTGCLVASGNAAAKASIVPSPPSAIGASTTRSAGRTEDHPAPSADATTAADAEPLNESGATTTTLTGLPSHGWQGCACCTDRQLEGIHRSGDHVSWVVGPDRLVEDLD